MTAVFSLGCWLVAGYAGLRLFWPTPPTAVRVRTHRRRGR